MLQEALKSATKPDHDTLESLMFVYQIMAGTLTLQQYKQILTTNYIVHEQLEKKLMNKLSAKTAGELDIQDRQKLEVLKADMQALQMELSVAQPDSNMTFSSEAEALGALYVLEGATLGGNVIVKRLKVNPNLTELDLSFNYYQVYGENLIPNWKKFCEVLNKQPEDTYKASINGAKKMFAYIAQVQRESNKIPIA